MKTSDLAKDAVTGDKVRESTLGKVPSAARADSAGRADSAAGADHASAADTASAANALSGFVAKDERTYISCHVSIPGTARAPVIEGGGFDNDATPGCTGQIQAFAIG